MIGILAALAASASWGAGDFLGGITTRRAGALAILAISQPVGLAIAALAVLLVGGAPPGLDRLALAALAGLGAVAALGAYYLALAIGPMAIVAPIAALGVAVPVAAGVASGERPDALASSGIAVAVAGVALAARRTGPAGRVTVPGLALAALAALGFGTFLAAIAPAAAESVPWAIAAARTASVCALVLVVLAASSARLAPGSRVWGAAVAIGCLDVSANLLYATATTLGPLSLVAVAGSLYPAVVAMLARAVLGDRLSRLQAVGVGAALAGIAMISLGSA